MKSAKCPECGFVGWADAEVCKKCGAPVVVPAGDSALTLAAPDRSGQNLDEHQTYYYPSNVNPFPEDLKNGWAISSLVSGILNFLLLSILVVPTIAGIVISVVALKKINRRPLEYGGRGMAVGGLVLNIVSAVALVPVMIIAAIAIPNLLAARRAANEGSAINALRNIHTAEMSYQATVGRGHFGSLADLERQNLINPQLASGTRSGYKFNVDPNLKDFDGHPSFEVMAVPTDYPSTGKRSFFIDETGVIRGEDNHGLEASRTAPALRPSSDYSDARSLNRGRPNTSDE